MQASPEAQELANHLIANHLSQQQQAALLYRVSELERLLLLCQRLPGFDNVLRSAEGLITWPAVGMPAMGAPFASSCGMLAPMPCVASTQEALSQPPFTVLPVGAGPLPVPGFSACCAAAHVQSASAAPAAVALPAPDAHTLSHTGTTANNNDNLAASQSAEGGPSVVALRPGSPRPPRCAAVAASCAAAPAAAAEVPRQQQQQAAPPSQPPPANMLELLCSVAHKVAPGNKAATGPPHHDHHQRPHEQSHDPGYVTPPYLKSPTEETYSTSPLPSFGGAARRSADAAAASAAGTCANDFLARALAGQGAAGSLARIRQSAAVAASEHANASNGGTDVAERNGRHSPLERANNAWVAPDRMSAKRARTGVGS